MWWIGVQNHSDFLIYSRKISFVKRKWEGYSIQGNKFQTLKEKLKMLKSDLKG